MGRRSTGNRPTDDFLLTAAIGEFRRRGYRATTMAGVAEAADTTKPTLYAHFGSKEEMYLAATRREVDRLRSILFRTYERAAELSPSEEVRADVLVFFEYAQTNPDSFALLFDDGPIPDAATKIREQLFADAVGQISHRLRARIPPTTTVIEDRITVLASLLVSMTISGARTVFSSDMSPEQIGQLAGDVLVDGLAHLTPDALNR